MPDSTTDRRTRRPVESVGWIGSGLVDFQLTYVPERPGWRWDAYRIGPHVVERGWTRTKLGARFAMWRCDRRWQKRVCR